MIEAVNVGVPREIKKHEYRVGATPHCVRTYSAHGHSVYVQSGAGVGSGYEDEEYKRNGATIVAGAEELYGTAEMVVKVKEPLPEERGVSAVELSGPTPARLLPASEQT